MFSKSILTDLPWSSGVKYSSIAVTSACSGVGGCFIATHNQDEPEAVRFVQLTEDTQKELSANLKENIREKAAGCIDRKREELKNFLAENNWNYSAWKDEYTPKYSDCVEEIPFEEVLQDLFDKGKDELFTFSVV